MPRSWCHNMDKWKTVVCGSVAGAAESGFWETGNHLPVGSGWGSLNVPVFHAVRRAMLDRKPTVHRMAEAFREQGGGLRHFPRPQTVAEYNSPRCCSRGVLCIADLRPWHSSSRWRRFRRKRLHFRRLLRRGADPHPSR